MRNYIILNNQRSDEISGLIIQELAPISKPLQRTQVETIDGRDGDIVTPLGYAAYDKKITIGLYGDFDINEIIAYFATQGTAIFSNEPDKYYNYQILDQIDYERLVRFRVATVTMHVQPFKYSATEGTITVDSSDTVSGEGSNIVLENTAEAPFNVLRHKGNITQDGTPTPSAPVPVQTVTGRQMVTVAGKNLLRNAYQATQTINGVTITSNADGTITANGAATGTINFFVNGSNTQYNIPAGTYTLSTGTTDSDTTYFMIVDKSFSGEWSSRYTSTRTITVPSGGGTIAPRIVIRPNTTLNNVVFKPMIERGSTATTFEPYEGQNYEINLGKNLLDVSELSQSAIDEGIQVDDDGVVSDSTPTADGRGWTFDQLNWHLTLPSGTYTATIRMATPCTSQYGSFRGYTQSGTALWTASNNLQNVSELSFTFTLQSQTNIGISAKVFNGAGTVQLEKGSTASSYAPYFTPIELAAIGDYADEPVKVGDTRYIRRAVGKVVLDGSENWSLINAGSSNFYYNLPVFVTPKDQDIMPVSDYFVGTPITNGNTSVGLWITNAGTIRARKETEQTLADFKTWLGTVLPSVYYVLATPTDEEITDQALIDALDDFYEQAHAYKGRTHVTATAQGDNAPAILSVEVNENNESTIVNSGNTASRPIITIYGQGNIGMYINDVQVLDIALGDEQYITIDSVAMEAYKGTTANLKNRLVTGDYSKLALNAGDNKIYFTGKVTKYEISKYSRWL